MKHETSSLLYQIGYRCFYVMLLYAMCLLGAGELFGIYFIDIWDPAFAALVLVGVTAADYGRLKGKTLGMGLILLLFFLAGMASGAESIWEFWNSYGTWLAGGEGWQESWRFAYELVQSGLLVMGCYLVQLLLAQNLWLKYASAAAVFVWLLMHMIQKKELSQATVAVFLWYMLLCFVEAARVSWKKRKGDTHRAYLLQLLPFCGIYLLLLFVMPAPEKPYDWKAFKDAYHTISEKVNVLMQQLQRGDQEDFSVAQVGFSGGGNLVGQLTEEERELMTVKGNIGLKTNVYLTGKIYDTFDGRSWKKTITSKQNRRWMDTLETMYAIRRREDALLEDYVYRTELSLRYEYFDTGYLFVPLKSVGIEGCNYQARGDDLVFPKKKGYGTEYTAAYFQMNTGHPGFDEMLVLQMQENRKDLHAPQTQEDGRSLFASQMQEDEQSWNLTLQRYAPAGKETVTLEELAEYRNDMGTDYGKEVLLTQRTKQYLGKMTKDAENQVERLRAIEAELSSFPYSANPGKLPEGIDSEAEFLEYFLLENPKGYCAYFATAFVLLARAEGLPARYVEGFCIPINTKKEMTVTEDMAHAWPEVYFEGIGWIPFEPTPGYGEVRYTPWQMESEKKDSFSGVVPMQQETGQRFMDPMEPEEAMMEEPAKATTDDRMIKVLLSVGLFAGVGILLVVLADMLIRAGRYRRMGCREQFLVEVRRILWLLAGLGYARAEHETIAQLQQKAREGFGKPVFLLAFSYFEAYLYGEYAVTDEMLSVARQERNELLFYVKQKRKLYYYLALIRLGIMEKQI